MKKVILLVIMSMTLNLNAQTWTNYTSDDGLIEGIVSSLIIDNQGKLWFSSWGVETAPGIGNFDGTTWNTIGMDDGAFDNEFYHTLQDSDGNYWFCSFATGGVSKYDGSTWIHYTTADGLVDDLMFSSFEDSQGNLWFVGGGISVFDGTSFTNYSVINGEGFNASSMVEDFDGNFWIGSSLGLLKFDGTDWEVFTSDDGFSMDQPGVVFLDSNNNIWVASYTDSDGIDKFDGTNVTSYSFSDGILNIDVRYAGAIAEDSNGTIYFGTNFGIAVFDGANWSSIALAEGLPEEHVRAIEIDEDGILWISTFFGLSKYNPLLGVFDNLVEDFALYPNPTDGVLNIQSEAQIESVEIYSMLGTVVKSIANNNTSRIDVSAIAQGTYWVKVTDADGLTGFKKILIK